MKFASAIVICVFSIVGLGAGLSCYRCLNIKGAPNPVRNPADYDINYGSGCDATSLKKEWNQGCESGLNKCGKFEATVGNVSIIVRECIYATEDKCARESLAPHWSDLKSMDVLLFNGAVLPQTAPAGSDVNICSCKKDKCNGGGRGVAGVTLLVISLLVALAFGK